MTAVTLHVTSINSARYTLHPQTFATKVERARDGEARVQRQTCAQAQRGVKSVPKGHAGGSGLFHLALLSCMSCASSFNLEKAVKFQQVCEGPWTLPRYSGCGCAPFTTPLELGPTRCLRAVYSLRPYQTDCHSAAVTLHLEYAQRQI